MLVAWLTSGCQPSPGTAANPNGDQPRSAFGPIPDAATAIRAALASTDLSEPIRVVRVEQGAAGALVSVPSGMVRDQAEADRQRALRLRPAWGVTLIGLGPESCDREACPQVELQHQLAIDRDTGEVLLQMVGGDLEGAPNLDVTCPGDPRCLPG